ncbi:hypothetical protein BJX96DRAFT_146916 [Aspergillus floccosus]
MSHTSHSREVRDQENPSTPYQHASQAQNHSVPECIIEEPPLDYGAAIMAYLNGRPSSLMSFGPDQEKRVETATRLIEGQGLRGIEKNLAIRDLMRATWKRNIEAQSLSSREEHFTVSKTCHRRIGRFNWKA